MPSPIAACGIAIMAKASAPGRTKTRLVPPLTYEEAAAFNTAFLKDVAHNILTAAEEASLQGYAAFGPSGAEAFFEEIMPPGILAFESWLGPFGACLGQALDELFERGHQAAVVLNADSPTLPPALLVELATELARPGDRAVLGPAIDGGYYLLGVKQKHPRLLEDIDWSTERVAEQTLARASEIGLPVHQLTPWYDVDEAATMRLLHGELFEGLPFNATARSGAAVHSTALMQRLLDEHSLAARLELPRR